MASFSASFDLCGNTLMYATLVCSHDSENLLRRRSNHAISFGWKCFLVFLLGRTLSRS
jgi:hypothetical protein